MAIFIDDIRFAHDWADVNLDDNPNLIANPFFEITAFINGYMQIAVDATVDNEIQFAPDGFVDSSYITMVNGGGDFREFDAGDSINILGSPTNDGQYTVVEKFDDSTIRIDSNLTSELSTASTYVQVFRTYDSAIYKYGLMENSDTNNFTSNIDSSLNSFYIESDSISSNGVPLGVNQSWLSENDSLSVNLGSSNGNTSSPTYGRQGFTIIHKFLFHPFYGHAQVKDSPPNYFVNDNALKYGFNILLKPFANSLSNFQELTFDANLGNTGWFNERYNTGQTKYSISDIVYTKVSDSSVVSGIQLTDADQTHVKIDIQNVTDSPFTGGSSRAFVAINYIPQNSGEYRDLPEYLNNNLYLDRAVNDHGAGGVAGDFARYIENFTVTEAVLGTTLILEFDVNLSSGDFAELFSKEQPEYLISVGVHDPNKDIFQGDGVTLIADCQPFSINLGLANLTTCVEENFYQHYDEITDPEPIFNTDCFFKEDEFVLKKRVKIDSSESQYEPLLKSISAGVRITKVLTGEQVDLYSYSYDASLDPLVNGMPVIDSFVSTGYQVDPGQKLSRFTIKRDLTADTVDCWFYDLQIPAIVRWEFWEDNNIIPNDLFLATEENNNLNNNWDVKDQFGYTLNVFTRFIVEIDGTNYASETDTQIDILNYDEGLDYTPFTFEVFDSNGNLLDPNCILGFEKVTVKACTDYIGGGIQPLIDEVELVLRVEPTQNGGHFVSTRFSTVIETENTFFDSLDDLLLPNLATKTLTGTTYCIEACLNSDQLPDFNSFDLTARIYDSRGDAKPVGAKELEDGECKLMEDGSFKIID